MNVVGGERFGINKWLSKMLTTRKKSNEQAPKIGREPNPQGLYSMERNPKTRHFERAIVKKTL